MRRRYYWSALLAFCCSCVTMTTLTATTLDPNNNMRQTAVPFTRTFPKRHADPDPSFDWDSFTFSLNGVTTDYMWLQRLPYNFTHTTASAAQPQQQQQEEEADIVSKCLVPFSSLSLHPAATVLNYGQSLFEGVKAFRRPSDGSIVLFRPEMNELRMSVGARRFLLPFPSNFLTAITNVVRANSKYVPPCGKGALYLRPLLFGSGPELGVKPSTEGTFCIYASPVGNYFSRDGGGGIKLQAVKGYARASIGGSGNVKAGGNYAPPFWVQREVRSRGFDEALFLDALSGESIEEAGASNFFAVYPNNTIVTPSLASGTILPGVTRDSIIQLARAECHCEVIERRLTIPDLVGASEAFCCGTGACITPVSRVNYYSPDEGENEIEIHFGPHTGELTKRLHDMLVGIQTGTNEALTNKYSHWIHVVDPGIE